MSFLNMTIIAKATSANYAEGIGNIARLKKFNFDGKQYTYISQQALKSSMKDIIRKYLKQDKTPIFKDEENKKGVIQFSKDATIDKYAEPALFGYMRTAAKQGSVTRKTRVAVTKATSLESYKYDTDFLTNGRLAQSYGYDNNIAVSEQQTSYYKYSVVVDLDELLKDTNTETTISKELGYSYVKALLIAIENLSISIRGSISNLSPIFVVGSLSEFNNVYYHNATNLVDNKIDVVSLQEVNENSSLSPKAVGIQHNAFNYSEIKSELKATSVVKALNMLKEGVKEHYEID